MSADQVTRKDLADALLRKLMQGVEALERSSGKKLAWERHLPPGPPRTYSLKEIADAVEKAAAAAGIPDQLVHLQ